jgi:hypothetical protein
VLVTDFRSLSTPDWLNTVIFHSSGLLISCCFPLFSWGVWPWQSAFLFPGTV